MLPQFSLGHAIVFAITASLLSACAGPPFSYAEDRCTGSYNQCRLTCTEIRQGGAQSACFSRCLDRESQCRATGDDGVGSSLAQDDLIGRAQTDREKEQAFQAFKARKQRERIEAAEAEAAEVEVIEAAEAE